MKKLLPRQKAFCDYYLESGNATKAAIKAGYNKKYVATNTQKLLKNTTIKTYIAEKTVIKDIERLKKANEVLIYLTSVMRGQALDTFGIPPSIKDRTKAAKLLLKRYKPILDNEITEKKQLELEHKRLINKRLQVQIENKL